MGYLKAMPISLKVLSVLLTLWVAMTIAVTVSMPDREIAFFGVMLKGSLATMTVVVLDILCPLVFIYAAFKRLGWGAIFGIAYNGIFFLNCVLSLFLFMGKFGDAIYFPLVASAIFLAIIFKDRKYFVEKRGRDGI
jgi:hypothetical protein